MCVSRPEDGCAVNLKSCEFNILVILHTKEETHYRVAAVLSLTMNGKYVTMKYIIFRLS